MRPLSFVQTFSSTFIVFTIHSCHIEMFTFLYDYKDIFEVQLPKYFTNYNMANNVERLSLS